MEIEVEFFGPIKRPWPERRRRLLVKRDSTVGLVMERLGYGAEQLRMVALTVNGLRVEPGHLLSDGDELVLVLLAGGG